MTATAVNQFESKLKILPESFLEEVEKILIF